MTSATLSRLLLCCALGVLSGCSEIARSGPGQTSINHQSADLAGFTVIDMTAGNVADYRVAGNGDNAGTGGIPAAPRVSLSPGDVLNVKISESKEGGLFAPLSAGGTLFANVRVSYDGTISLPYAGKIKVSGLDPVRVGDRIQQKLAGVTFEPQVYVELVADRGSSVLVAGAVKSPGRFSMMDGPATLIDAISKAGGPALPPHQTDVIIRRGSHVTRIPLVQVENGRNMQLRAGDEILLEANVKVFNALGAVSKVGQVEFTKSNPSLMDALGQVGGLDNTRSSNTGVFVFRLDERKAWRDASNNWQQSPVIFKFDMSKPETMFVAQVFGLRPNDTIYVTNAPAVEWVRVLQPIALTLSTLRGGVSTTDAISNSAFGSN